MTTKQLRKLLAQCPGKYEVVFWTQPTPKGERPKLSRSIGAIEINKLQRIINIHEEKI
jgi:hypothetical protein